MKELIITLVIVMYGLLCFGWGWWARGGKDKS